MKPGGMAYTSDDVLDAWCGYAEHVELNCGRDHLVIVRPAQGANVPSEKVQTSHEFELRGGVYVCITHGRVTKKGPK